MVLTLKIGTVYTNMLNKLYKRIPFYVMEDGEELREYIHVKDAAKITVKAMNKKYENQFLTISGINSLKAKDLFIMIGEILNKKIIVKYNKNLRSDEHYKTTPYNYIPKDLLR